jgi:L-amino acid N-acyltransferase YncA
MSGAVTQFVIRRARAEDAVGIVEIYNEGIRGRTATFETREREAEDVRPWIADPRYPVVVAETAGEVLGWARAHQYRPRDCYVGVGECSVYVRGTARQRGVGLALMNGLADACAEAGFWKLVSRVFPENRSSRSLCARCGFREVGTYYRHARLDGQWRDVVIVERLLEGVRLQSRTPEP